MQQCLLANCSTTEQLFVIAVVVVRWSFIYDSVTVLYRTCMRCLHPLTHFFTCLKNPKFSASVDVYAPMFFCDLVTFLIVVFGYDKFGPSVSLLATNVFLLHWHDA